MRYPVCLGGSYVFIKAPDGFLNYGIICYRVVEFIENIKKMSVVTGYDKLKYNNPIYI